MATREQYEYALYIEERPRSIATNIETGLFISDLPSAGWIEMVDKLLAVVAAAYAQATYHPGSVSPPLAAALEKITWLP